MLQADISTSRDVLGSDVGRLLNFTDNVTFTFITGTTNFTGKRFEFFNSDSSAATIKFAENVVINGQVAGPTGLSITLAPERHVTVMGIDNEVYIAWFSDPVTLSS